MLLISKHALLREKQRAIPTILPFLLDEYAIEWESGPDRLLQLLQKYDAKLLEGSAKRLIKDLKFCIKELKRVEKKTSSRHCNMQVISHNGAVITEVNSSRVKRRER
jgi:hypothetical protein